MTGPVLWFAVGTTTIHGTLLLYGAIRFRMFLNFCRSANASGYYTAIKNILVLLLYAFAPSVAIGVTFTWVSYGQGWGAGNFFCILPFIPPFLMLVTILITKNDISNQVDVARKSRTKLPAQGKPAPFIAVVPDGYTSPNGARSPPGMPALPIQDTPVPPRRHEL
jgi:hypothetical protein